ncbi:MAG: LysR family transcriptional regulator, partial [Sphingobium sp.]
MVRLPSLTSLRLLTAIAQHSSVSMAAAKLGITQSAASRRIAALET